MFEAKEDLYDSPTWRTEMAGFYFSVSGFKRSPKSFICVGIMSTDEKKKISVLHPRKLKIKDLEKNICDTVFVTFEF